MSPDLLQDLAQYKKARDKPVATAARALISLFRELAPGMLEKKDRGKGESAMSDRSAPFRTRSILLNEPAPLYVASQLLRTHTQTLRFC
jgi:hypothetical protein